MIQIVSLQFHFVQVLYRSRLVNLFCSYYHLGISIPEYCLINMETYYNINAVYNEKADFCLKVTIVTKKLQKPWLLLP